MIYSGKRDRSPSSSRCSVVAGSGNSSSRRRKNREKSYDSKDDGSNRHHHYHRSRSSSSVKLRSIEQLVYANILLITAETFVFAVFTIYVVRLLKVCFIFLHEMVKQVSRGFCAIFKFIFIFYFLVRMDN